MWAESALLQYCLYYHIYYICMVQLQIIPLSPRRLSSCSRSPSRDLGADQTIDNRGDFLYYLYMVDARPCLERICTWRMCSCQETLEDGYIEKYCTLGITSIIYYIHNSYIVLRTVVQVPPSGWWNFQEQIVPHVEIRLERYGSCCFECSNGRG